MTLAQAVHLGDPDTAVPADQYILRPDAPHLELHLRPGRYRLRLERMDGFRALGVIEV